MKALARAEALLADLLRGGPREAAQILAAAEGAKIAWRSMQRASDGLGVVKTREAFRGGWTWRLPAPDEACTAAVEPGPDRAAVIAARLRKFEAGRGKSAPIFAGDPRVIRWAVAGISDPDLREVYERAVFALRGDGPVSAGHLDQFVAEVMGESA